jgi:hypothetical protein
MVVPFLPSRMASKKRRSCFSSKASAVRSVGVFMTPPSPWRWHEAQLFFHSCSTFWARAPEASRQRAAKERLITPEDRGERERRGRRGVDAA